MILFAQILTNTRVLGEVTSAKDLKPEDYLKEEKTIISRGGSTRQVMIKLTGSAALHCLFNIFNVKFAECLVSGISAN